MQLNTPLTDPLHIGSDTLVIGRSGSGEFLTDAGSEVLYSNVSIAKETGSSGEAVITGAGSNWSGTGSSSSIQIGEYGSGGLLIDDGAIIDSHEIIIASQVGSRGDVDLKGAGTRWNNSGALHIAHRDYGTMRLLWGAELNSGDVSISSDSNSSGSLAVIGTDPNGIPSSLSVSGNHYIGHSGNGSLEISAGAVVNSMADVWLARFDTALADVVLDGPGTEWNIAGHLRSGSSNAGRKYIEITNGGVISSQLVDLRSGDNSETLIAGPGALWSVSQDFLYSGGINISEGGRLTVEPSALVEVDGSVRIEGNGSTWNNPNSILFGHIPSQFSELIIDDGGSLLSGTTRMDEDFLFDEGVFLYVTVAGSGSEWQNSGDVYVGGDYGDAGFWVVEGGQVSNSIGFISYGRSSYTSARVRGAGSRWENDDLHLGYGLQSDVTLEVSRGGTLTSNSAVLAEGQSSGSTVSVEDIDSLWHNSGDLTIGDQGTGTLDVLRGTVQIGGNIIMGKTVDGSGTVTLNDGKLELTGGTITKGAGAATLDFQSGRLEGASVIDLGAALVQEGGTLVPGTSPGNTLIEGGYTLDGGALEIEINGIGTAGINWDMLSVNGTVDLLGSNATSDGILDVVLGFAPSVNDEFLILENDGADAVLGMFADGSEVMASYGSTDVTFTIDYTAGDGNDVSLIATEVIFTGDPDLDGNGSIDAIDFLAWQRDPNIGVLEDWQTFYGTSMANNIATVPEPSSCLLMCAVAGLLLGRRGR